MSAVVVKNESGRWESTAFGFEAGARVPYLCDLDFDAAELPEGALDQWSASEVEEVVAKICKGRRAWLACVHGISHAVSDAKAGKLYSVSKQSVQKVRQRVVDALIFELGSRREVRGKEAG